MESIQEIRYYSPEQFLDLINQLDLNDFNSVCPQSNADNLKFTRLGVYNEGDDEELLHLTTSVWCHIPNCNTHFDTVFAYENHYNAFHRYICSQCRKQLPSAHLLDLHLSEKHDSFFAAQAERKAMYACYLEQCLHKSQAPDQRRDHCITEHKFPHDFRFDAYNYPKKGASKKKTGTGKNNTIDVSASSAMATNNNENPDIVMDKNCEITNKSITSDLVSGQQQQQKKRPKPMSNFSFGQGQTKTFVFNDPSYAKKLTKNYKGKAKKNPLDDKNMCTDLLDNLPN